MTELLTIDNALRPAFGTCSVLATIDTSARRQWARVPTSTVISNHRTFFLIAATRLASMTDDRSITEKELVGPILGRDGTDLFEEAAFCGVYILDAEEGAKELCISA